MRKSLLRNPKGARDWLPDEVAKQEFVRNSLVKVFELWGYRPVQTPILINFDTLGLCSSKLSDIAFKLVGEHGELLALRADLTTPVARVTAERLNGRSKSIRNLPLRFYYVGKVFRYHARKMTNERELYQIGVELIGPRDGLSDLECLKVLTNGLDKLGIKNYLVLVNHVELWSELKKCFGDIATLLYKALSQKDFIIFEKILCGSRLTKQEKEFWRELIQLKGNKSIIKQLKNLCKKMKKLKIKKIISYFEKVFKVFNKHVEIDLSLTSDIDYYTGIYFEVITPYLGRGIGSGGRYDALIKKFGYDIPAIGFSLCLEDLLLVLEKQGKRFAHFEEPKLVKGSRKLDKTFNFVNKLHKKGKHAALKL